MKQYDGIERDASRIRRLLRSYARNISSQAKIAKIYQDMFVIEEGATNLIKLQKRIDTSKMKEPSFMIVLTAIGDYAYKRKDGVLVVPVGCLGVQGKAEYNKMKSREKTRGKKLKIRKNV